MSLIILVLALLVIAEHLYRYRRNHWQGRQELPEQQAEAEEGSQ
jgi:uncharacterized membrane protein affecting hemolysin expression